MPTLHLPAHSLIRSLVHLFIPVILSRFIIDRRQILRKKDVSQDRKSVKRKEDRAK
jgi:hypothetical protein